VALETRIIDLRQPVPRAEAAVVAARALHDDPFFAYLAPNARLLSRGLTLYWDASLAAFGASAHCEVTSDGDRIVAVAAWLPPGAFPLPARAQTRQMVGALRALYRRPLVLPDGLRSQLAVERAHPHDEHWYLALLAVDPLRQRTGLGGTLVGRTLDRCDREGLPAYLETTKEENIAWYARHRFALVGQLRPIRAGPPIWTMRREPR
jgi:GNAT superfamily N-acetyltransferase